MASQFPIFHQLNLTYHVPITINQACNHTWTAASSARSFSVALKYFK